MVRISFIVFSFRACRLGIEVNPVGDCAVI
jgi:hypothetical protein